MKPAARFSPVGEMTDSEEAFCWLISAYYQVARRRDFDTRADSNGGSVFKYIASLADDCGERRVSRSSRWRGTAHQHSCRGIAYSPRAAWRGGTLPVDDVK